MSSSLSLSSPSSPLSNSTNNNNNNNNNNSSSGSNGTTSNDCDTTSMRQDPDARFMKEIKNTLKFKLYRSTGYDNEKEKMKRKTQAQTYDDETNDSNNNNNSDLFEINTMCSTDRDSFCVTIDTESLGDKICDVKYILDFHKKLEYNNNNNNNNNTTSSTEINNNKINNLEDDEQNKKQTSLLDDNNNNNNNNSSSSGGGGACENNYVGGDDDGEDDDSDDIEDQDINNDIYLHVCPSIRRSTSISSSSSSNTGENSKADNKKGKRRFPSLGLVAFNMTRIALLIEATIGEEDIKKLDLLSGKDYSSMTPEEQRFIDMVDNKVSSINEGLFRDFEERMCIINSPYFYEFSVQVEIDERNRMIISAIGFTMVTNSSSSVRRMMIKYRSNVNILSNIKAFCASRYIAKCIKKFSEEINSNPEKGQTPKNMTQEEKLEYDEIVKDIALTIASFTIVNGLSFTFLVDIYSCAYMYYFYRSNNDYHCSIQNITWQDLLAIGINIASYQHTIDFGLLFENIHIETITAERMNEITIEVCNVILNSLGMFVQLPKSSIINKRNKIMEIISINKYFI